MKITIQKLPPAIFTAFKFRQELLEEIAKTKCPEIGKRNRNVIRGVVTTHYQNVIDQVRLKLAIPGGIKSIDSGSAKRIFFTDVEGSRRAITTDKKWPALSEEWINAPPHKSLQFWHKSGELYGYFMKLVPRKATVKEAAGGRLSQVSKNKWVCRSKAIVGVQPLPYPLSQFIVTSFLTGKTRAIPAQGWNDRTKIAKTVFPEYFRPFISKMAASLGKRMHTKLRKVR